MKRKDKSCPKKATKDEIYLARDCGIGVRYLRQILKYGNAPVATADRLSRLTGQPIERFLYRPVTGNHTAKPGATAATVAPHTSR
jgi:hypothetical protein